MATKKSCEMMDPNSMRMIDQLMTKNRKLKKELMVHVQAESRRRQAQAEESEQKKREHELTQKCQELESKLIQFKTVLGKEQIQRSSEKTASEKIILNLTKKCQELEAKCSLETKMRDDIEKRLHNQNETIQRNKELISNSERLKCNLQTLASKNKTLEKTVEEITAQLIEKEKLYTKSSNNLAEKRNEIVSLKTKVESLLPLKEVCERLRNKNTENSGEITNLKHQGDIKKTTIQKLEREICSLNETIEDLKSDMMHQSNKMKQLEKDKNSAILEIEKQTAETEKQYRLVQKLEGELNKCTNEKWQLEDIQSQESIIHKERDRQILSLNRVLFTYDKQLQMTIEEKKQTEYERRTLYENSMNLCKEMNLKNKMIEELQKTNSEQSTELKKKNLQLIKIRKKHQSLKNQVERFRQQLREIKSKQHSSKVSADKDKILTQKVTSKLTAENEQLNKELAQIKNQLIQQQQVINRQDTERVTLQNKLTDQDLLLRQYNTTQYKKQLKNENSTTKKTVVQNITNHNSEQKESQERSKEGNQRHHPKSHKQHHQKQDENNKQNEEEDNQTVHLLEISIQKLQQCRWDKRELTEKVKALQAVVMAYEDRVKKQQEQITMLINEERKLKLKAWQQSKHTPLPPISKKPKPPDDTSKDNQESEHVSGHACFPITSSDFQCQSTDKSNPVPHLPLVGLHCQGTQIRCLSPLPKDATDKQT